MTTGYIELPVVTDSTLIVQEAFSALAEAYPGWVPREGNLEVLILELMANMVAQAATVASDVPQSIFEYYGSLVGINPNPGVSATIETTWTLTNPAPMGGYQISAGTSVGFYFEGAAYQFNVVDTFNIAEGDSTQTGVIIQAIEPGAAYNIYTLSGVNPIGLFLTLQNSDPNVSNVVVTATYATDGSLQQGTDPESTAAYLNRLSAELQLLAPRPITPSDYAQLAQNVSGVDRALVLDGFNPYTNIFTEENANLTNQASLPSGWTTVGNGVSAGTTAPTVAMSTDNFVTITMGSTAIPSPASLTASASHGAESISVVGTSFYSSASSSHPVPVLIVDGPNREVALVIGVSGGGPQLLTLASPLVYDYTTSATVTALQGTFLPKVESLHANAQWYQVGAILQAASGGELSAVPYLVALVEYDDGSYMLYSSRDEYVESQPDYPAVPKLVTTNILSHNPTSNPVANSSVSKTTYNNLYNGITAQVVSVTPLIVWHGAGTGKVHEILYASLNMVPFDFSGAESPDSETSSYNWIPDASLTAYAYPSLDAEGSSWALDSGLTGLPGFGLQYQSASNDPLGGDLVAASPIFELNGAAGEYTLIAYIDPSQTTGDTYDDIVVEVVDGDFGSSPTVLATLTPSSTAPGYLYATFTEGSPTNVRVVVTFQSGLTVPLGTSVVISQMQLLAGALTPPLPTFAQGWAWTPGGLFTPNAYVAPRSVAVCPVDVSGNQLSIAVLKTLEAYLESYREMNFEVASIVPNYVPVNIQWSAVAGPGYSVATVQAAVQAALYDMLSPANWAGGTGTPPFWDGSQVAIRLLDVAGVIARVTGVTNVTSISMGTYDDPLTADDILMGGIAPLPIGNTILGSVFPNPSTS